MRPLPRLDDSEQEQHSPTHSCPHFPLDLPCHLNTKALAWVQIYASNSIWRAETEPTSPQCTVLFHRIPYQVTGGRARA